VNVIFYNLILSFFFSCEANSLELWLTHCWPSVFGAITSTNRFLLFEMISVGLLTVCSYCL